VSEVGGAQASRHLLIGIGRVRARGNNGGGTLRHGRHVLDMRRPLGHFTEYVVGSGMGKVGVVFGPDTGRFGPWAQKQSCSPPNDQQNSIRVPSL